MPLIDDKGIEHIISSDEISAWGIAHLTQCAWCQKRFPNSLAKLKRQGYQIMSDELMPKQRFTPERDGRFVEDDLMLLKEIDNKIRELISQRAERVEMIKKQNAANQEALNVSEDWFEGDLKGMPVPARYSDEPNEAPMLSRERPNGF
jgi:hypothetical protein